jgi:hypothetical protein
MTFYNNAIVGATFNVTYTIVSKTICASDDPIIEFTSNIILTGFSGTLTFQIFKYCYNQLQPSPIGPQWNFSREIATTEATTFSFFVCDRDTCFDESCCTYRALVTFVGSNNPQPPG